LSSQILTRQEEELSSVLETWVKFMRAHSALTRELSSRLEARHGLTLNDFDVLVQLYYADGHRLRRVDLARSVLLTASGITRLLDGLERSGWVEKARCSSDARVTYAVLTEAGHAKYHAARETHVADVHELFGSRFSPAEMAAISDLVGRLPLTPVTCDVGDE
jgi:DNA-binding MarR family transcriptional regulator